MQGFNWSQFFKIWPGIAAASHLLFAIASSTHAVLTKDDSKSAVGWVGLIWLSPFLGAGLYYIFGINRIRRKAVAVMGNDQQLTVPRDSRSLLDRSQI